MKNLFLSVILLSIPLFASAEKIPEEGIDGITFTYGTTMIDFTKKESLHVHKNNKKIKNITRCTRLAACNKRKNRKGRKLISVSDKKHSSH